MLVFGMAIHHSLRHESLPFNQKDASVVKECVISAMDDYDDATGIDQWPDHA